MVVTSNLSYIENDKFRVIVCITPKASQNSIVSLAHETNGSVVIKTLVIAEYHQRGNHSEKNIEIAKYRHIVKPVLTGWIKGRTNKNV